MKIIVKNYSLSKRVSQWISGMNERLFVTFSLNGLNLNISHKYGELNLRASRFCVAQDKVTFYFVDMDGYIRHFDGEAIVDSLIDVPELYKSYGIRLTPVIE